MTPSQPHFIFSAHKEQNSLFKSMSHFFNAKLICGARSLACDPHRERAQREPRVRLKIIRKKKTKKTPLPPANCLAASCDPQEEIRHQDWKASLYTERKAFVNCFCVIVVCCCCCCCQSHAQQVLMGTINSSMQAVQQAQADLGYADNPPPLGHDLVSPLFSSQVPQ